LVESTKRDFNRITISKTIKAKWNSHSYKFSKAIRAIIDELESNLTEDAAGETTNPPYIEYLRKIVIAAKYKVLPTFILSGWRTPYSYTFYQDIG
jgi:hypothetical protein